MFGVHHVLFIVMGCIKVTARPVVLHRVIIVHWNVRQSKFKLKIHKKLQIHICTQLPDVKQGARINYKQFPETPRRETPTIGF